METVRRYRFPPSSFPRYRYSATHVTRLMKRSRALLEKCGFVDGKELPTFGDVIIDVLTKDGNDLIPADQLEFKKGETVTYEEILLNEYRNMDRLKDGAVYVGVVSEADLVHTYLIPIFGDSVMIGIGGEDSEGVRNTSVGTKSGSPKYPVTTAEKFSACLSNILESRVFSFIKTHVEVLQCLAEATLDKDAVTANVQKQMKYTQAQGNVIAQWALIRKQAWRGEISKTYKNMPKRYRHQLCQIHEDCFTEEMKRLVCNDMLPFFEHGTAGVAYLESSSLTPRQIKEDIDDVDKIHRQQEMEKCLENHIAEVHAHREDIKQLAAEIFAMYRRSNVHDDEKPRSDVKTGHLREEIAKLIFTELEGAVGCGYKHDQLHIFVETENLCIIQQKAKDLLKEHGIEDCVVRSGSREYCKFMNCTVGSKIRTGMHGTLGGFVKKTNDLYVLLARHVAELSGDVHMAVDNRKIANVLPQDTFRGNLDIAVAKVDKSVLRICDTRFKESSGEGMVTRLHTFNSHADVDFLQYLPVHIWGGFSSPGKGKITIPEYFVEGMEKLILVEDLEEMGDDPAENDEKRFAKSGDSGAIVCADEIDGRCVRVISMLSGGRNWKEIESNPGLPQEYLTVPLQSGIKQLNQAHGGNFELC